MERRAKKIGCVQHDCAACKKSARLHKKAADEIVRLTMQLSLAERTLKEMEDSIEQFYFYSRSDQ